MPLDFGKPFSMRPATVSASPSTSSLLSQLPFLLRLLDDPSPVVQERITLRLRECGEQVWPEIERLSLSLTPAQERALKKILAPAEVLKIQNSNYFLDWLQLSDENERLEAAYGWLAREHWGPQLGAQLHSELDRLASEYLEYTGTPDPKTLAVFLFEEKGLCGAEPENFYDPAHSELLSVIQNGYGLPISLACIFILIGHRLGLKIVGCNFPGHFMARAPFQNPSSEQLSLLGEQLSFLDLDSQTDLVFDCYHGGRVLSSVEIEALRKTAEFELRYPASAVAIISRVLHNLATAYHTQSDYQRTLDFLELRKQLKIASRMPPRE